MGFNRRSGHLPKTPPPWAENVGAIRKHGTLIRASCSENHWHDVDVGPIIEAMGPDYSLWDKRPKCRKPGCPGRVLFLYSGKGILRPMKS